METNSHDLRTYVQVILPFLSSPEKRKTSWLESRLLALEVGLGFHVSSASTMVVTGLKLQANTSAENWGRQG